MSEGYASSELIQWVLRGRENVRQLDGWKLAKILRLVR